MASRSQNPREGESGVSAAYPRSRHAPSPLSLSRGEISAYPIPRAVSECHPVSGIEITSQHASTLGPRPSKGRAGTAHTRNAHGNLQSLPRPPAGARRTTQGRPLTRASRRHTPGRGLTQGRLVSFMGSTRLWSSRSLKNKAVAVGVAAALNVKEVAAGKQAAVMLRTGAEERDRGGVWGDRPALVAAS